MDTNRLKAMIGNKIYDLRTGHGLTQQQFAERLGTYISKGHISKVESGIIMPSAEFIRSVCISFNISPQYLLNIELPLNNISPKEENLLNLFRILTPEDQVTILRLVTLMAKEGV